MDKKEKEILNYWKNKGVDVLDEMPEDWEIRKGALTQPNGYVWTYNGKSLFEKDENGNRTYRHALVKIC